MKVRVLHRSTIKPRGLLTDRLMKFLNAPSREQRNSLTVVLRQRLSPTLRKSRKERQQKQLKKHL